MPSERIRNIKCIENIRELCLVVFSDQNKNESEMYIVVTVVDMYSNIRKPCLVVYSNQNTNESAIYIIAIILNMYSEDT